MKTHRIGLLLSASVSLATVGCGEAPVTPSEGTNADVTTESLVVQPAAAVSEWVLSGQVLSADAAPAGTERRLHFGILWDQWTTSGDDSSFVEVPVTGGQVVPGPYSFALTQQPPKHLINSFGGVQFGMGYIIAASDRDGDGRFDMDGEARAWAGRHIVFYIPKRTEAVVDAFRKWGRLRNPEALVEGYNLTRGICTGELFDDVAVVADPTKEDVDLVDTLTVEETGCINVH